MHGNLNIKFIVAKQAKEIYKYKTTKRKMCRTNAAIWFNKTCRHKQLTPTYINISINGITHNTCLYVTYLQLLINTILPELHLVDLLYIIDL